MVKGTFVDNDKPMVPAFVSWNQAIQNPYFILDTGFTGDLVVTREIAKELNLEISGMSTARTAADKIVNMPTATAIAVMEGVKLYVTVFITDGWPLLGISFLQKFGYKAIIDCKKKTVSMEVSI